MTSWARRYKDTLHDYHCLNGKCIIDTMFPMPIDLLNDKDRQPTFMEISSSSDSVPEDLCETVPDDLYETVPEDLYGTVPEDVFKTAPQDMFNNYSSPAPIQGIAPVQGIAPWYVGGVYQGAVRPVTAPTQQYETGVQLLKFKRYRINTRPSTR